MTRFCWYFREKHCPKHTKIRGDMTAICGSTGQNIKTMKRIGITGQAGFVDTAKNIFIKTKDEQNCKNRQRIPTMAG